MRIHDKPHFIKYGMTALLVSMSLTAWAETLTSQVVGVADGDTITVLDANN
jgi:hypothetical protein